MNLKVFLKKILRNILPAYRVALRIDERLNRMEYQMNYRFELLNRRQETLFWLNRVSDGESLKKVKKEFFQGLPEAEGTLRNHQLELLELLKKFKEICRENGISYWLDGGCLIGSERNNGFIPWDDDLDVSMLRQDFERLEAVLLKANNLKMKYFYCYYEFYCMPKVVLTGNDEVFIDICIHDEIDEKSWGDIKKMWLKRNHLQKASHMELQNYFYNKNTNNVYGEYLNDDEDVDFVKKTYEKYRKLLNTKYNSQYIAMAMEFPADLTPWCRCYDKETIFPLREALFEGEYFSVPKDTKMYLQDIYGDIYSIPNDIGFQKHLNIEAIRDMYRR